MVQKETAKRGRPRAYDPEMALICARDTFWERGFAATSLDDLSAATGMNRPSLYAAFGDKQAIYQKAFDTYADAARAGMKDALAPERPLREGLRRVYDIALSIYLPPEKNARGCFMIGTAVTEAAQNETVRAALARALSDIEGGFEARFKLAKAKGEIARDANPRALGKMAAATLYTMAIQSRVGGTRKSLNALADAAIGILAPK